MAIVGIALLGAPKAGAQDQLPTADELPLPEPRPTDEAADPEDAVEEDVKAAASEAALREVGV